jgi:cobalt/nickel transport system permease protein
MYRFIFLIIDEVERLQIGYSSRYIYLPLRSRLKMLAGLIATLFIRTYERGERIYLAMESRGFKGRVYTLQSLRWRGVDSLAGVMFVMVMIAVPLLFWQGR